MHLLNHWGKGLQGINVAPIVPQSVAPILYDFENVSTGGSSYTTATLAMYINT